MLCCTNATLQVANKRNGVDVDKFDYLKRDSMMCGVGVPLDARRLMLFSRLSPARDMVRITADQLPFFLCLLLFLTPALSLP